MSKFFGYWLLRGTDLLCLYAQDKDQPDASFERPHNPADQPESPPLQALPRQAGPLRKRPPH